MDKVGKNRWLLRGRIPMRGGTIAAPSEKAASRSFSEVFFQNWAPPLIAATVAACSTYVLAIRNDESSRDKAYLQMKVAHADETAKALGNYISIWRRVILLCERKNQFEVALANVRDAGERERAIEAAKPRGLAITKLVSVDRPKSYDELTAHFDVLQLYFSQPLVAQVAEFRAWDDAQVVKTCRQMPRLEDYRQRQARILDSLRTEVGP